MPYDLEERTFKYTKSVMAFVNQLPISLSNQEAGIQLIRAAGSIGANYIEANEALSKKDFVMRIKISKKESKESRYWLGLTTPALPFINSQKELIQEATELMKIFAAILAKST